MAGRRGAVAAVAVAGIAAVVVAPRIVALVVRLDRLLADVEKLVRRMNGAITAAEDTSARAVALLAEAQAGLRRVEAALRPFEDVLGDRLPTVLRRVDEELVPALDTLGKVGPDVREVLQTVEELRSSIAGMPALQALRRRRPAGGGPVVPGETVG